MRVLRFSPLSVLASAFLLFVSAAMAQNGAPASRIVRPIDESQLVTLKGTVHPLANAKNDRGALPDSTQLDRIHLVLKRSAGQEAALEQLIGQLHTPGNPNFHKWLTPDQFGKQFGPSDQDIATVETWLTGRGFSVTGVNPGKQTLEFSGNVGQFRSAFHAQIHRYEVNGQTHTANASDPQIPAALAPVVAGFVSLNNFRFKNNNEYLGKANYNPKLDRATPLWTIGPGGSPYADSLNFVLAPQDFYVQYDLNPLYTASTPINGSGQTIAIVNDSNVNIGLVNQFRTLFGLPANPPQVIVDGNDPGVDGINNPDGPNYDSGEAYIDVEWSGAVAPAATVDLVVAGDTQLENGLFLAIEHAVYGNIAPVMSLSFGACEANIGSENLFLKQLWQQAAAQGVTVMVSTGDSGSAVCDRGTDYAVSGQAVSGFASTPYNVAVGGTDFYYSDWAAALNNPSAVDSQLASYWNVTPSDSTPGVSIKAASAPIPEQPWNDSQFGDNILSYYAQTGGSTSIAGGSGGASTAAVCAGNNYGSNGLCAGTSSGYPKPSWQVGTGVPSDGVRDLPDVSLFASNGQNDTYYPVCAVDGDCQPVSSGYVQISGYGGTSVSSPAFAGMMALVNQKYGPQGQADFVLYPLAKQFPAAFHDVVNGSNTVPCAFSPSVSPNCIAAPAGLNYTVDDPYYGSATEGQIGKGTTPEYNAGVGYDLASGLGTVDANQLVTNWGNVKFDASTTTLTPSQTTFTHGTSITVSGSVTGSGTPTGSVALMTNSTEAVQQGQGLAGLVNSNGTTGSTFALNGSGAFSGATSTLPGGTYNIWGAYSGDGTNALSTSTPVQITVNPESSGIAFSILSPQSGTLESVSSGTTNISYGTELMLDAQVLPSTEVTCVTNCPTTTEPTGSVTFTDGTTPLNSAVINAEGDAEFNPAFAPGTHSVSAAYSGDGSYNASTASPISFTVVQDTPEIVLNPARVDSSNNDLVNGPGQPTVLTVQIENSYQYLNNQVVPVAAPTGTVTLTSSLSGFTGTNSLSSAVDPATLALQGVATYVVPAGSISGNYNITVAYNGDANYTSNSLSGSFAVETTSGDGAYNSTTTASMTGSISPTTSVVVTGTVTGESGKPAPTGVVYVYSSGNYPTGAGVSPAASGDTSSFSIVLNSQTLFQGSNQITIEYFGDTNYNPSAVVLANTLTNTLADFSMTANTTIIPVTPGGTGGTTTVNVASVNGFSGAVSLTCSSTGGVTCTAATPSISLASGGSGTSKMTISAPSTTAAGSYNVLITGTDPTGKYVHTLGLRAQVASSTPGFALTSSGGITVSPGATTGNTSTITATPSNGFTGGVNLTCALTNPPAGNVDPTCFVTSPVTISGTTAATSTLTITTSSTTTPGTYTVTVTGTDVATGKITSSTPVSVTVTQPPSFALTNSGAISFQAGATAGDTATITVTPSNGFTGNVALTCAVTPVAATSPATCSATSPVNITGATAGTSTVTISTTSNTTPGSYTATVTGTNGAITASTGVGVTITAPPTPAITLTNNGPLTFVAGAATGDTATITVTPTNGFTGNVSLTCTVTTTPTSSTSPATCGVTSTVDVTGTSAVTGNLTVTTTATTTPGAYVVTVTGKDASTGKITSNTLVTVNVTAPPSFALTNSGAISFGAGATTGDTATITITPAGGFTGNVNLTCAITPTAATSPGTCAVTTPVNITGTAAGTSTLTITTTLTTTPGSYTATVTGTDAATGKITSSTPVSVTVTAPPPPAIALSNSGALAFAAGATTGDTATITVTPSNGFTGNVSLTCAVTTTPTSQTSPATCGVSSTVDVTGTGAVTGTLTVTTTSTTTPGAYVVTVTGKDASTGKVTSSTAVNVTVNAPPSFALTNTGSISFQAGATTGNTVAITITPAAGFTGNVNLTCAITPTAASSPGTCTVTTPVNITGTAPGSSTLSITSTLTTTPGSYTATVTGKDAATGLITASTTVTVTVTAPPPPAIALTNSGALSFVAGATTGDTATITVTPSYGFTGNVNVTCAVTPVAASSPATCSVGPTVDITGTGAQMTTLTVATTATTTPGSYTATVSGADAATGKVTGSTAVNVTVQGIPGFGLTNNGPITFGAGLTSGNTATITVTPVNNFTSSVTLMCAVTSTPASPTSPATCSTSPATVAGGSGTATVNIVSTSTTTPGSYSFTVTGTAGTITEITVVSATVNASYGASAGTVSPSSVTPGGTATDTITVTSGDGYAGTVTLSCALTSSPSGASDLPSCTGPSSPLTLSSGTATGTVTVTTTGATSSELVRPKIGPGKGWLGAGGGAILALMLFFGIPARRRSWRTMLGALVLMVIMGAMAGCGGGGGGGGGGNSGTTAGNYVFTVTATGSPAQGSGNTTTFTVDVN